MAINSNIIKGALSLEPTSTPPNSPNDGDFYFDATDGLKQYHSGWKIVGAPPALTTIVMNDNSSGLVVSLTDTFAVVEFSIDRGPANREVGNLFITNDGTNAYVTTSSNMIGDTGTTFTCNYFSGGTDLFYTLTNSGTNATLWYSVRAWS